MESQKILNSQSNPEKKNKVGGNTLLKLQIILQSQSNQSSMVLEGEQTHRKMEQN